MANEKNGIDIKKAAATKVEATPVERPDLVGNIRFPQAPDYVRNLFEKTRAGTPVVRPDDLVALRVETRNLEIIPNGGAPRLRKKGSGASHLILHFPPQSFAEETFFEQRPPTLTDPAPKPGEPPKPTPSGSDPLRPPPVRARIANESRLVFTVPEGFDIEYSLASILAACRDLPLKVSAAAKPRVAKPRPLHIGDLLDKAVIKGLPIRRQAALASAVVNTMRIGAMGDMTTLQARQFSVGAGFKSPPGLVDKNPPGLSRIPPGQISTNPGLTLLPPQPAEPDATTTSIEMPWRLILSPHEGGRWRHASAAVTSAATHRTELWHSRLVTPHDGKEIEPPYPDPNRTTRAIWALGGEGTEAARNLANAPAPMQSEWPTPPGDKLPKPDTNPFRTTLDNFDRYQIAHLSANFRYPNYTPEPLDTNMMMLTALGGFLDSRGAWDPPGLSVEEWVHRSTMGRDHYVRVVYRGFLFPFGHRVSLVKVSERKFHNGKATAEQTAGNVAYLRQRLFMIIREKERTFEDSAFLNAIENASGIRLARQFPFTRVKLLTETTPDLGNPQASDIVSNGYSFGQSMFWPYVNDQPFHFQCAATDLDGRRVVFDLPMIFMDNTLAGPRNASNQPLYDGPNGAEHYARIAMDAFNAAGPAFNTATLDWQRVALAPGLKSGDTSVQVQEMKFGGFTEAGNQNLRTFSDGLMRPVWVPKVSQAKARIGPVAHLSGAQSPHTLTYNSTYLRVGFDPTPETGNRGEVFLDVLAGSGPNLDFSSQGDKSGGFVQPNLKPAALSRLAGPLMSDPADFIKGKMPQGAGFPTSLSDLPLPFLFGCIPLGALIEAVSDVVGGSDKVPKFGSEAGTQVESFINSLVRLFEFVTSIASQPAGIADAALAVFKATLQDLIQQAQAYAAAQVQPVINAIETAQDRIEDLVNDVQALLDKAIDAANSAPELSNLPTSISALRTAINNVKTAANASPGGVSLPAGFKQSILNAAQKLSVLLDQLDQLQALITSGKSLWDALSAIVGDPEVLSNLFNDPDGLATRIDALGDAMGGFRTALEGFDLLDGAPRNAVIAALKGVEDVLEGVEDLLKLVEMLTGDELTIRFDWNPEISSWSLDGSTDYLFVANDKKGLVVAVEAKVKKNGSSSPKVGVVCGLKHFDLVLIAPASFLELNFEKIEFSVDSSAKMNVDVLLSDIKFLGPLSFVETLRDLIPLDGFSDPPYLDITPQGIDAGFDIALPSITCGVLNIANISLGAGFTVPFIGQPLSVRFNFCRRDQPFLLTVYIFGGGGFFGVTIDPQGVQLLEASFEFGAAFSIDFGVASGGVHVMAGIYFRMEQTDASLTGYFRLGGHVDVLGIITASIELYLELRYEFSSGKCVGKAELTIEISLFIFSGSVTITCERKFAGSNGDPSLRQMLGYKPELTLEEELLQIDEAAQYAWREHLEAFA
jgi:hypothetical protein